MRRDDEKAGRVEERKGGRRGKRWLVKAVEEGKEGRQENEKTRKRGDEKMEKGEDWKAGSRVNGKTGKE